MKVETKMPIPETVGELIELLKTYPKDYKLDIYTIDVGDSGSEWENTAYWMNLKELENIRSLEITIR